MEPWSFWSKLGWAQIFPWHKFRDRSSGCWCCGARDFFLFNHDAAPGFLLYFWYGKLCGRSLSVGSAATSCNMSKDVPTNVHPKQIHHNTWVNDPSIANPSFIYLCFCIVNSSKSRNGNSYCPAGRITFAICDGWSCIKWFVLQERPTGDFVHLDEHLLWKDLFNASNVCPKKSLSVLSACFLLLVLIQLVYRCSFNRSSI